MRGKIGKKSGNGRIEMAGDFSIVTHPYLLKVLKNVDDRFNKLEGILS